MSVKLTQLVAVGVKVTLTKSPAATAAVALPVPTVKPLNPQEDVAGVPPPGNRARVKPLLVKNVLSCDGGRGFVGDAYVLPVIEKVASCAFAV